MFLLEAPTCNIPKARSRSSGDNLGMAKKLYLRKYCENVNGFVPKVIYTPEQHAFCMQFVSFVCDVHEFSCFHVMCSMMCSNDPFFTVERYLRSSVLLSKFPPLIFHFQTILLPYFKF